VRSTYLYLDRLQAWLKGGKTESAVAAEQIHKVAAE
jgi:hypothetical protein